MCPPPPLPMSPEDLAALHARCFDESPPPWSAAAFAGALAAPGAFLLTAGGAFLLGRVVADEAELLTLAVAPENRRQGTARALLGRFEAGARARGAAGAFLEVAASNAAARALYYGYLGLLRAASVAGEDPATVRAGLEDIAATVLRQD